MIKKDFKKRILEDLRLVAYYTLFFGVFFSAFTTYRYLIEDKMFAPPLRYGYNFLEALVLSKIILIGQALHIGEHYKNRALIIPTIYKTVAFSIFVFIFSILEHFFIGFIYDKSTAEIINHLLSRGINEILANLLIMVFVFLFFFAFLVLGEKLGKGKLFNYFFKGEI